MLIGTEKLDLRLTLVDSAQCFRWTQADDGYGCVLNGNPVWLKADAKGITAEGDADVFMLRHYLDLDRDYTHLADEYADIPVAQKAIAMYPGLRILNQNPWETLITFILSANNNVTRIRTLCDALCKHFGKPYRHGECVIYDFPTPEQLADCDEATLRGLRVGYRAPYLIGAAKRVVAGFPLQALRDMPYAQAHAQLITLPGVGDKVADCILLFGCEHTSAFPVDVWVEKLLKSWFGVQVKGRAAMLREARKMLGTHAGLLQQFLFHAARTGAIELD